VGRSKNVKRPAAGNRYAALVEHIFIGKYRKGLTTIPFSRDEFVDAAKSLGVKLPKNIGDTIYSARYRQGLPQRVRDTAPRGKEWIIEGVGRGEYAFKLAKINRIVPNENLVAIKVPDATPEIVGMYALSDEQALLAKVRYNRLIDIFLSASAYSLQNHLRTTISSGVQVEIDEIYVAVDRHGCQYVIPVQAKGGSDELASVQTKQDIRCCSEKFPALVCRAVSTQFMADD